MKYVLLAVIILTVLMVLIYASYQFKRSWNYNWAYKSRVEQTVCEMVKPEYLIKPC